MDNNNKKNKTIKIALSALLGVLALLIVLGGYTAHTPAQAPAESRAELLARLLQHSSHYRVRLAAAAALQTLPATHATVAALTACHRADPDPMVSYVCFKVLSEKLSEIKMLENGYLGEE